MSSKTLIIMAFILAFMAFVSPLTLQIRLKKKLWLHLECWMVSAVICVFIALAKSA